MNIVQKIFVFLWQWLIAYPILFVATLLCAIFTILLVHWKDSAFVHGFQQLWSRLFFWLFFMNPEVEGEENLQKGQSYVFVGNHTSMYDAWLVYGWLPVVFKWIMKASIRKIPFVGTACKAAGHIFIQRGASKQAMQSLEEAKSRLQNGVCVVIFPEGTRSLDGNVAKFKRGAFQIAFDMQLPVVPLSLSGVYDVLPKDKVLVHPARKVKLKIGKPIDLSRYAEDEHQQAIEDVRELVIAGIEK
ncbi:MAG: 1-acyl-sn-glycerol-3-phosphate acyltransferase [Paludibacteraceae bacterium]|nr:1-acyl-sn-glycerol-3-phosphate acyltransferase [Paludibacteraceae bacterium]